MNPPTYRGDAEHGGLHARHRSYWLHLWEQNSQNRNFVYNLLNVFNRTVTTQAVLNSLKVYFFIFFTNFPLMSAEAPLVIHTTALGAPGRKSRPAYGSLLWPRTCPTTCLRSAHEVPSKCPEDATVQFLSTWLCWRYTHGHSMSGSLQTLFPDWRPLEFLMTRLCFLA